MDKRTKIIATIFVIVAVGFFMWNKLNPVDPKNQPDPAVNAPVIENSNDDQTQTAMEFNTMDEYVALVLNEATNSQYEATPADDTVRISTGENSLAMNFAPKTAGSSVYALASSDWSEGSLDDSQQFWLEVETETACNPDTDCNGIITTKTFGPFTGKLKMLAQ